MRRALGCDQLTAHECIFCTVENGYVTLDGTVGPIAASESAEESARNIEGVCGVTNRIKVTAEDELNPVEPRVPAQGWC